MVRAGRLHEIGGGADHRFVPCADAAPRPCGAGQQNIPAVQREAALERSIFHRNFGLPGRQVAPHIVGPTLKKKLAWIPCRPIQQPRNAPSRVPRKVSTSMRKPTCFMDFYRPPVQPCAGRSPTCVRPFLPSPPSAPSSGSVWRCGCSAYDAQRPGPSVVTAAFHFTEAGERRKRSRSG